jgi:hypothetical protein
MKILSIACAALLVGGLFNSAIAQYWHGGYSYRQARRLARIERAIAINNARAYTAAALGIPVAPPVRFVPSSIYRYNRGSIYRGNRWQY